MAINRISQAVLIRPRIEVGCGAVAFRISCPLTNATNAHMLSGTCHALLTGSEQMTDLSDTTNRFVLEVIDQLDEVQHETNALWLATKGLEVSAVLDDVNALSSEVARLTDRLRKLREKLETPEQAA
jgi:hypothetical protein